MTIPTLDDDANYDESLVSDAVPDLSTGGGSITDPAEARKSWLKRFETERYGTMPSAPDAIEIRRFPMARENAERIEITLRVADRSFTVDAALWLPRLEGGRAAPIALGLDFLGPIGSMFGEEFPIDPGARIPRSSGAVLHDSLRGTTMHRWPAKMLTDAGYAVLTSCYGSWTPDSESEWRDRGVWPLTQPTEGAFPGAIALWAWAIRRLVDVAEHLLEIDPARIAVAGHSRLGKAALLAAAHDTRIGAALINNSGSLGASLASRNFGETEAILRARFPHWLTAPVADARTNEPPLDQHHLLAAVAPRGLYVTSASEDLWADPKGELLGLAGAAPMWPGTIVPPVAEIFREDKDFTSGGIGWHLRPGPHDIRPYDWRRFLRSADDVFARR
jgi:hypothetical protein